MAAVARLAVVGAGLIGRRHMAAMALAQGVVLDSVVDPGPEGASVAQDADVPHYPELAAMLVSRAPDGVVLATPTGLHVAQALACVAAGVPVLVEKPLGVSVAEAAVLVEAAQLAGVPLLVGHHRRHNGLVARAKAMIEAGAVGDIRAVQATCWFWKPDDYFETAPWRKEKGAGPISVNLVHDVDLLRHLCGEIVGVQASASAARRGYANEDVAAAVLTFASGAIGTIAVSDAVVAPWSWEMTAGENPAYPRTAESFLQIGGSEGALTLPDLTLWRHQGAKSWWSPIAAERAPGVGTGDPLVTQLAHFGAVIAGAAAPLVSGVAGLRALAVVEAIQIAAETGRMVVPDTRGLPDP